MNSYNLYGEIEIKYNNIAIVFGLSENGISISKSLARSGITVIGITHFKEIGVYSRYNKSHILPHPIKKNISFINKLKLLLNNLKYKPILFISSDEYLSFYVNNENFVHKNFISTLPSANLIKMISNKYELYLIAKKNNIPVPDTYLISNIDDIENIVRLKLNYPLFIKGNDVNQWREIVSSNFKGFVVDDKYDLKEKLLELVNKNIFPIVQEIILGDDVNNYKGCVYYNKHSTCKLFFSLQKIHHYPIHFGIGSYVISKKHSELKLITKKLFSSINYNGIGSAEFKIDKNDGKLKLIEINPRYWQQNSLADFSGINFPYIDYLESLGEETNYQSDFNENYKWINLYLDFCSYLQYRKEKSLTFIQWINNLKGKKIISFFDLKDPKPLFIHFYRVFLKNIIKLIR